MPVGVPSVLHGPLRRSPSLPLKITSLRSWSRPGEVLLKIPPPKPVPLVISVVPDGVPSVLQSWFRAANGASEQDGVRRHDCDHRAACTIRAEMEPATNEAGSRVQRGS